MSVSFFVIEDHSLTNLGVREFLQNGTDFSCAGFAYSEQEAFEKLTELTLKNALPTVLVLDLFLGDANGIDILREVTKHFPAIKTVVYSMYSNPGIVSLALETGAKGFVSKSCPESELVKAVKTLAEGGTYVQQNLLASLGTFKTLVASLTKPELSVLNALIERKGIEDIPEDVGISPHAAEVYITRILSKTGCKDIDSLIAQFG